MAEGKGEAGMHFTDIGCSGKEPGKAAGRRMEIGHPVLEILGATKSDRSEIVATDDEGRGVLQRLLNLDPLEISEAHLLGEPAGIRFRAVGGVAEPGKKKRVFRAEFCRSVVEVLHRLFPR